MDHASLSLEETSHRSWDVIIVGTGMSGSTLGYALARAGKQVLFCEKGRSLLNPEAGLRGDFAESFFDHPAAPGIRHREILLRSGRYADLLADLTGRKARHEIPFIGCGTGGSSALYGCALERFFPADFTPGAYHRHAADSTLPASWPVRYEDMIPYYENAEQLYRVRGGTDPCHPVARRNELLPPQPLGAVTRELEKAFVSSDLHPYRLPQACEFVPGCRGCQGFLCPNGCKNDSSRICLKPALERHGAALLDECDVHGLEANRNRVTGVVCSHRGRQLTLHGDIVILAAGALETPRILLNSRNEAWPEGLANNSGLVGRNLMRHFIDLYALAVPTGEEPPGNLKELAFNDFYLADGEKLGTVQSFGALPSPAIIAEQMEQDLRNSRYGPLVPFFRACKPLIRPALGKLFSNRALFASIMEDLPYPDNRVMLSASATRQQNARLSIRYIVRPSEKARIRLFRDRLRQAFRPCRFMLLGQAENNERIAHACGTCRFGLDPGHSVLNASNRAHDVDNLYVIDASFFPSSGGTNPALTLAANALRVADHLLGKIGPGL